jgi:tetratricopeptide (TPR) repeat protein
MNRTSHQGSKRRLVSGGVVGRWITMAALESVLERDIAHPGACHLYIHAVEASRDPGRAVACAELLEDAIPGVSHIPHMPAHVLVHVGRWGDAVRGNQKARMADVEARKGRGVAVYPTHNLHMLLFAASYDGQSAVALQAARDLARESPNSAFFLHKVMARFGRWAELLETEAPDAAYPLGVWRYARGLALLRTGEPDSARAYRDALAEQRDTTSETARFRAHLRRDLLGIAHAILAGEIAAAAGEHDEAVRVLRDGVATEDGLIYDEPEPWLVPVRQVLGMVLLVASRAAEAEAVFRDKLRRHPENGWSLLGLERSLREQGREEEAEEVQRRRGRAWQRADVWRHRCPPERCGRSTSSAGPAPGEQDRKGHGGTGLAEEQPTRVAPRHLARHGEGGHQAGQQHAGQVDAGQHLQRRERRGEGGLREEQDAVLAQRGEQDGHGGVHRQAEERHRRGEHARQRAHRAEPVQQRGREGDQQDDGDRLAEELRQRPLLLDHQANGFDLVLPRILPSLVCHGPPPGWEDTQPYLGVHSSG